MLITGAIAIGIAYAFLDNAVEEQEEEANRLAKKLLPKKANTQEASLSDALKRVLSPLSDDNRREQLNEIATVEKSAEEITIDKNINLFKGSLGLSLAGIFVTPLRILAFAGLVIGTAEIFKDGYKSLKKGKIDSYVLMAVASIPILASGYLILAILDGLIYFYGKKLLTKTEDQTVKKIVNLFGEQVQSVWLVKGDLEVEIPFERLKKGDIISVRAGEMIPVDGEIVSGNALVNQQALTGEAQPIEKNIGDTCFASTINLEGYIQIEVTQTGNETVAAQIGEMMNQSLDYREVMLSKGQDMTDRAALPLLALSAASIPFIGWAGAGAVSASSNIFVVQLTSPILALNYLSMASHEGILIKDGRVLELLDEIDTVIFDKTGTLTLGQPHVGKVYTLNEASEKEVLTFAATAEYRQTHPIALAILEEAEKQALQLLEVEESKYNVGFGITVRANNQLIQVGSGRLMELENISIPTTIHQSIKEGFRQGHSYVYVAINGQLQGVIELQATIRPEAKSIVQSLRAHNKACYIISGDHEAPTRKLAQELGISNYFAEVLPEDKADLIVKLQEQGRKVCFVGDGINDSIALKKANVSISLKGASAIATDTAQVILMGKDLRQLPLLFSLGQGFNQHMQSTLTIWGTVAAISISGALFFGAGIWLPLVLSQAALTVSVGNAIRPIVIYEQAKTKAAVLKEQPQHKQLKPATHLNRAVKNTVLNQEDIIKVS